MPERDVTFGRYRLDRRNGLTLGSSEVRLTPKALALLCFLAERPGQLVTKEELFDALWPRAAVGDAALVSCIQELRKALRDDARRPHYIETLHRRGYRFVAKPVVVSADDPAAQPAVPDAADILVGRDDELAQLDRCLTQARRGERQVAFVTGEPGIGKTALVKAFVARVAARGDVAVACGQAAEHFGASEPYLPVLEALGSLLRAPSGRRLVALLDQHAPSWLAQMPSLLDEAQRRDLARRNVGVVSRVRMLRELNDALDAMSADAPLLLCLEDLHWSDWSTVDWLAAFVRRDERSRVMVVATYRPAELLVRGHPLHGMHVELRCHRRCREIAMPPLSPPAVADYLAKRLAVGTAEAEPMAGLAHRVHRRSEGSPLFMVGVLDALVAQGALSQVDGRWVMHEPLPGELGIPDNLQRLIEHQLDRLAPLEQRLLETASVIGAEFSAAMVAVAAECPLAEVEAACAAVARRQQLIRAAGVEHWADRTVTERYRFHHALYRDALYRRLTAGRRAELHRRAAECLQRAHGEQANELASELAMHYQRGHDERRAIEWLRRAGRVASLRGAASVAAGCYSRALELLAASPAGPERHALEAELNLALSLQWIALHGFGSTAVEDCALRAKALCDQRPELPIRFAASRVVWNASLMRHPVARTLAHARDLMALAAHSGDSVQLALAHRALGTSLKLAGDLRAAYELLERGAALADTVDDSAFVDFGEHPGMVCRAFAGWTRSLMGFTDDAQRLAEEAISHGRRRSDPHGTAFSLVSSGMVFLYQRDAARVNTIATEVLALTHAHQLPQWLAFGQEMRGWALFMLGEREQGIQLQVDGLRTLRSTGARTHAGRMLANLAECHLLADQADLARPVLDALRSHGHTHGERYYAAELPRLWARLRQLEGASSGEVEGHLRAAIEIARDQHAALLELRAAADLARLLIELGGRAAARDLLAPIVATVREGVTRVDAAQARALLSSATD